MYKLNGVNVTEKRVDELISDLAMFPSDKKDIEINIQKRKEKYMNELLKTGTLTLSNSLKLTLE